MSTPFEVTYGSVIAMRDGADMTGHGLRETADGIALLRQEREHATHAVDVAQSRLADVEIRARVLASRAAQAQRHRHTLPTEGGTGPLRPERDGEPGAKSLHTNVLDVTKRSLDVYGLIPRARVEAPPPGVPSRRGLLARVFGLR
jgi:hypothetical protein